MPRSFLMGPGLFGGVETRLTPLISDWRRLAVLLFVAGFAGSLHGATILWLGGNGNWSDPTRWNCPSCSSPAYPNNSLGVSYYVTDRKSTRLNSSHLGISYAVFCLDQ